MIKLCNEMTNRSKSEQKTSLLISLNMMVSRNPLTLTCGLFDFDSKLLLSMLSSAATNFIILIQFDIAFPKNELIAST